MPINQSKRERIIKRDEYTCQNCDEVVVLSHEDDGPTANVHHKTPRSKGGPDDDDNLHTLCPDCHHDEHSGHGVGHFTAREYYPEPHWVVLSNCDVAMLRAAQEPKSKRELADETGFSYGTINGRATRLVEHTLLRRVDRGVYMTIPDEIPEEHIRNPDEVGGE